MTLEELKKCDGVQVSLILDGKRDYFTTLSVMGNLVCLRCSPKTNQWEQPSPVLELSEEEMAQMELVEIADLPMINSNMRLITEGGKRVRYLA